jgi:hypothetical protein
MMTKMKKTNSSEPTPMMTFVQGISARIGVIFIRVTGLIYLDLP